MRRFLIVFVAVAWGVFVFLPGSVLVQAAAWRAAFATLPLVIAVLLAVDGGKRWRIYLRWVYAVLLAMFGILIWGGLSSIPNLVIATILLWPEIRGGILREGMKAQLVGSALVLGLVGLFIWWQWFHNPLPRDNQLVENFNTHRAEFEQLATGFRNHRNGAVFYESSSQEVRKQMKEVGVNHIVEAGGEFGRWFPEPYSDHTIQVRRSVNVGSINNLPTEEETMATYRRDLPKLFEGVAPLRDVMHVACVTVPIKFYLGPEPGKVIFGKTRLRYLNSFINKGYCSFPQSPRVENGRIVIADYSLTNNRYTRPGLRVFDSLDDYPPDWKRGECVLKRLDELWFITMCRS